jgi:hypothetical protein
MLRLLPLLAEFDPTRPEEIFRPGRGMRESLIVMGALAMVFLGALVWAAFFRKTSRRHHHSPTHHHHRHHGDAAEPPVAADAAVGAEVPTDDPPHHKRKHRRRRRRRMYQGRNPTLAETGGLPAKRADLPAPPPSAPPQQA